jgi:RNA polymerase sigma-70 factor (ECF subfamily)
MERQPATIGIDPMNREESSILMRAAKDGSREALDRILSECGPRLLALIRLRLGGNLRRHLESRDILQATLLRAFERLEEFDGSGRHTLVNWLAAIATNEIRDQADYWARGRRDAAREVPLSGHQLTGRVRSEVSRIHLEAQARRMEQAIAALNAAQREVVLLRNFEELSWAEVSERLGKSQDACRMLFARALTALCLEMRKRRRGR